MISLKCRGDDWHFRLHDDVIWPQLPKCILLQISLLCRFVSHMSDSSQKHKMLNTIACLKAFWWSDDLTMQMPYESRGFFSVCLPSASLFHFLAWRGEKGPWSLGKVPPLESSVLTFEESLDSAHLLDHGSKLGVLRQKLLHLSNWCTSTPCHPCSTTWLARKKLRTIGVVQF